MANQPTGTIFCLVPEVARICFLFYSWNLRPRPSPVDSGHLLYDSRIMIIYILYRLSEGRGLERNDAERSKRRIHRHETHTLKT